MHRLGTLLSHNIAATLSVMAVLMLGGLAHAADNDDVMHLVSATYKVANTSSTATSWIVSHPELPERQAILVSAAHVFENMKGDECRLVLRKPLDDGSFKRQEVSYKIRERNGKVLWKRHPKADVAAMQIELPQDHSVRPIPLDAILDTSDCDESDNCGLGLAEELWIFAFPAKLESSRSGFPVLRRGSVASFPLIATDKTRTFMLDYSTFGGDSGGPVFRRAATGKNSVPTIVGLIHGQHRETTKTVTQHEERVSHLPMGLAIVVHAKFIRETIRLVK